MPKKIVKRFEINENIRPLSNDQIEDSYLISQEQLDNAKIVPCREDYIKRLPQNLRYMEVGVAWGYYSKIVCETLKPSLVHLVDTYNQDMKCWSWRKFGECQCSPEKHTYDFTAEESEDFIRETFKKYNGVTFKGQAEEILETMNQKYDYIYIDFNNLRQPTRKVLHDASKLIDVGGVIGLNDYLIYDGVIEDSPYGTYQTVNEFLHYNRNWVVDALALHKLGFYDIYIRKIND